VHLHHHLVLVAVLVEADFPVVVEVAVVAEVGKSPVNFF
jgi:hypothetical protein